MATSPKKANRGHLVRAAKKGQLFVKCDRHLTDDYAFDAANEFGKQDDFKVVVLNEDYTPGPAKEALDAARARGAEWDEIKFLQSAYDWEYKDHCEAQRKRAEECNGILLELDDLRTKSGHMVGNTESGYFNVHSNLSYRYQIRK